MALRADEDARKVWSLSRCLCLPWVFCAYWAAQLKAHPATASSQDPSWLLSHPQPSLKMTRNGGTWIALSPLKTCQVLARLSKEGCIFAASASPDLCTEGLDFQVCQHWHSLHGFPSNAMNFNYCTKRGGPVHLSPALYQKSWFRIAACSSCQISFILNHCHLGVALHLENQRETPTSSLGRIYLHLKGWSEIATKGLQQILQKRWYLSDLMKSLWNCSVRQVINTSCLLYGLMLRKQNILSQQHIIEVFNSDTSFS